MRLAKRYLLAGALATGCLAALLGGGAAAQAAPPTTATFYNTPEPQGKVRLAGSVNPRGSQVSDCHFEYGPDEGYGAEAPCEGEAGAGEAPVEATAHLTGLTPGADYHYRLVATNASGIAASPDSTFRAAAEPLTACPNPKALGATFLAECRAWEMVSPPDKSGGDVIQSTNRTRMAADGSAAEFSSLSPFGDAGGAGVASEYASVRSPQGWSTHGVLPPQPPTTQEAVQMGLEPHYLGDFSPDLEQGVLFAWHPLDEQDPNADAAVNLYLREDLRSPGAGAYRLLSPCPLCAETGKPLPASALAEFPWLAGASEGFDHVIFESTLNLAKAPNGEAAKGDGTKLYEYAEGTLRLAGVLPNGKAAFESAAGAGFSLDRKAIPPHLISADGSKIFFTEKPGAGSLGTGNLYMRLNGTETVQLNASEGGPGPAGGARYWAAAADGSRVFFTSKEPLTEDAPLSGDAKLYMYDTTLPDSDPHNLTFLSVDNEPADPRSNLVKAVVGASADGDTVYFTDATQLVAGLPPLTYPAAIYAWHDGQVSFVADLPVEDENKLEDFNDKTARVSPSGSLAWLSTQPIGPTGYDQGVGNCPGTNTGACRELYVYDPDTKALQCPSCNPSGAPGKGDAWTTLTYGAGGAAVSGHLNRTISSDGSHVFFTSSDALLPADVNGVEDAYAYDTRTATLSLLSSGTDASPSRFMETNADGSDALFTTRERLSGWDADSNYDLYDARIGGGVPEPPPPPPSCQGDACQPNPPALNDPTPASASYRGAGNQVRKKKHAKKAHKHKKQARKHHRRAAKHERRVGR